jgi:hypothetical protein
MKKILLLITALFITGLSFSQSAGIYTVPGIKEANPAAAGFSAERLTRIDKI